MVLDAQVVIGALTDLHRHPGDQALDRASSRFLAAPRAETGGIATQNRGTIGGNIANASPAADTPPALLAYDAELDIASARGTRRIPYSTFHTATR